MARRGKHANQKVRFTKVLRGEEGSWVKKGKRRCRLGERKVVGLKKNRRKG